ncbi:bifunctional proline dehydrogenase/L-glutamate gamma-semialdehyde dehydrogenase PutA [Cereibacter sphaeroides]|uniref:bifunctional proline dehydrogenase/L-glutamate gamma-semialdehyde dehydrogenase PutA n=1 Tax=Cereibacter sphaeroides TaxID=1063 RepID=UPI001F2E515B|nr:bifunctional proline dehydrogenase/L-glutamate gamma-semialdehyde dehydrogenase PutA [Cereibacter sphaeroides]MCE6961253.1 bifunctional proline dehydrogenase/L-glutamate gamma-semialdehyde dehydrogenase PutA [Cereibacter sphaeroides]MCE6970239.1 bifunctional proline dehydrogenase/L-glutamate gamma-semialdehyde dehydrogenase PutA [Cereibacter sphaeroides]MCE6974022.1 bifunctional proline dehydrogenase/L-glutamate gamma-semialdehyde dehydrogenase PutA [Cereibacter sphaeroides]
MPATAPALHASDTPEDEAALVARLIAEADLDPDARARIAARGADLVRRIRQTSRPGLMEGFLAEYGLSTDEGIALMCLAEALLRVPDAETMDALIEDKIAPSDWNRHLGRSVSSLVNASTWALMLTGKVLDDREPGVAGHLRSLVKRLGEPVIRAAVGRAMKEMGRQFVLGETIEAAMDRAAEMEARGYTYSYDMLGEAARTEADARRYHLAYSRAITAIAGAAKSTDIRANPGISVKLSALHPRYEVAKRERVMAELVPRVKALAGLARAAGLGFNIDAEEAERLDLSLEVIEAALEDPSLAGWDGFGIVVQAYGRRAGQVIDRLYVLASRLDRRIMVRLVKGAYWDGEVKRAQVLGLADFPVFTRKQATDASYIANARKLFGMTDRIYPQFATHNAHTVAAILDMAEGRPFEFQRLHGMGERLHDLVLSAEGTRCRIYAPVGAHRDLLAYLVRRLLENGANSSFVNQIVDESVSPEAVAACPLTAMERLESVPNPVLRSGTDLFPGRRNSRGFDLTEAADLAIIEAARTPHRAGTFDARPSLVESLAGGQRAEVLDPAGGGRVGNVIPATAPDVEAALHHAVPWEAQPADRAEVLRRAADLYEAEFGPIFALLAREAGKTLPDAVGELREAVDFLRYYAAEGEHLDAGPLGTVVCISPWNFPLAIFTGQIAAALMAGNAVIAKPAEQTPLIAAHAVELLHRAGVPSTALQLLPGEGRVVGAALTHDPRVAGVVFTGSTETALTIRRSMAAHLDPSAPLIAETGGLNAMIVDSTALPEQAVRDILASSFQSAGQRCSALRCLYLQEDVAETVLGMLFGAMDELQLGDPWELATDLGPVIDAEAQAGIWDWIEAARSEGRILKEIAAPARGTFVGPTVIRVGSIRDMAREIFGPVLHVATFRAADLDRVIGEINATGYGLTFGLHSRIDDRVQRIVERLQVGNIYVNRNQIGAVVGSQPFGGEGLSGTGPKAGGPAYLARLCRRPAMAGEADGSSTTEAEAQAALAHAGGEGERLVSHAMPGPTGESNRLSTFRRAPLLCLGPGRVAARAQAEAVRALGGLAVEAPGLPAEALGRLHGFSGALFWSSAEAARPHARALAGREGPILPLIGGLPDAAHVAVERHLCIDTTASGGNAELLAAASGT